MKLWVKLSGYIFNPVLKRFENRTPRRVLQRSLALLDGQAVQDIRNYIRGQQTLSGGFPDKAGITDIYYTLFGFLLADALEMVDVTKNLARYVKEKLPSESISGIHVYCAYILADRLSDNPALKRKLRHSIFRKISVQEGSQPIYEVFLKLFTCYYTREYFELYRLRRDLKYTKISDTMPGSLLSAHLVIRNSFGLSDKKLEDALMHLYQKGGFKAVHQAPVTDLLSTAVALYALHFSGTDLRTIRPDCLNFIDNLFMEGGFTGNMLDPEPDIEYTFYGLLALGSLTETP